MIHRINDFLFFFTFGVSLTFCGCSTCKLKYLCGKNIAWYEIIAQLKESREEVQKALTTRITVATYMVSILQHKIEQPVQYLDRISFWLQYHLTV